MAGVVPASLARYIHLWQDIARAPLGADVLPLYDKAFMQVERDRRNARGEWQEGGFRVTGGGLYQERY
jgi:hypothetical protein